MDREYIVVDQLGSYAVLFHKPDSTLEAAVATKAYIEGSRRNKMREAAEEEARLQQGNMDQKAWEAEQAREYRIVWRKVGPWQEL